MRGGNHWGIQSSKTVPPTSLEVGKEGMGEAVHAANPPVVRQAGPNHDQLSSGESGQPGYTGTNEAALGDGIEYDAAKNK